MVELPTRAERTKLDREARRLDFQASDAALQAHWAAEHAVRERLLTVSTTEQMQLTSVRVGLITRQMQFLFSPHQAA